MVFMGENRFNRMITVIWAVLSVFMNTWGSNVSEGEVLRLKCQRMSDTFDYPGLRQESERLHSWAKRKKDKRLEAYACFYLAASELKTGPVENARNYALSADSLASLIRNDTIKASAMNVLGIIANEYDGNNAMALGYYLSAIDCAQRSGYRRTLAGIYSNISLLFTSHNDTAGLRYCRESLRISRETGKPEDLYYPACNLATVYLLRGDLHNAYKYASEAEAISVRHSLRQPELAEILMGSVLGRMGRPDDGLDRLDKAIVSLKSRNPSSALLAQAYFEKAKIFHDIKDFQSSNELCRDALSYSLTLGNRSCIADIYALMADNHEKLGETRSAYEALSQENREIKATVKVQDETIHREISRAFDLLQKEKQIEMRDLQISLHLQRIGILTGLLIVIAAVLFIVIHFYRKEKRLNRRIVSQFNEQDSLEEKLRLTERTSVCEPSEETEKTIFGNLSRMMEDESLYLDKTLNRESLAERLQTNRTYISKIVKSNTGLTLPQWINGYRIKAARLMLSDPEMKSMAIKEIADRAGFANATTFNAIFKENVGLSPSAYRKSALELQKV